MDDCDEKKRPFVDVRRSFTSYGGDRVKLYSEGDAYVFRGCVAEAENGTLTTEGVSALANGQDAEVCTPLYNVNIPEVS